MPQSGHLSISVDALKAVQLFIMGNTKNKILNKIKKRE
jgi:hypothetical protein